jgi:hypothetical protein
VAWWLKQAGGTSAYHNVAQLQRGNTTFYLPGAYCCQRLPLHCDSALLFLRCAAAQCFRVAGSWTCCNAAVSRAFAILFCHCCGGTIVPVLGMGGISMRLCAGICLAALYWEDCPACLLFFTPAFSAAPCAVFLL